MYIYCEAGEFFWHLAGQVREDGQAGRLSYGFDGGGFELRSRKGYVVCRAATLRSGHSVVCMDFDCVGGYGAAGGDLGGDGAAALVLAGVGIVGGGDGDGAD